jgi:glycosyltransferase involved in cell wall biosynthesis
MNQPLKIAIVVHGRFFAFDLARELIRQGHQVTVVTNYPAGIAMRWGVPESVVVSVLSHGLISRLAEKLRLSRWLEPLLHRYFARRASAAVRGRDLDAVLAFSGVAEEVFSECLGGPVLRVLVRASSHIQEQRDILAAEERRAGLVVAKPSPWMVAREGREYMLADRIFILGGFSRRTFEQRAIPAARLCVIHLAADLRIFHASPEVMEARKKRLLAGQRLRVVAVGTFSHRKGCLDLVELARRVQDIADVVFVGTVVPEAMPLAKSAAGLISFEPRVPEKKLPKVYAAADVFVMPTLEDGFAVVVAHAKASGLPVLVTENCDAADIIQHGVSGWVLPVRTPDAFATSLRALHENREALAAMSQAAWADSASRGWETVATETVSALRRAALELASRSPMKIAIGVHGRFHAFGLARGLLELGHEVRVFTNYPPFVVERFGVPRKLVRSHYLHGLVVRIVERLGGAATFPDLMVELHAWFGRWLAARLGRERWDVSYTWSSVSLEHLRAPRTAVVRLLARGSTHINWQDAQIEAEVMRTNAPLERPLQGIMSRERKEYKLADTVVVLSRFCHRTFLQQGHPESAVRVMVPGLNDAKFMPRQEALEARRRRNLAGEPLRVLMTGTFSFRKGAMEIMQVARQMHGQGVVFRVVGQPSQAAFPLQKEWSSWIEFVPRVPQAELRVHYEWADIFVLPSLEEGLAAVLWQAAAAGLPVLATKESGVEELLERGVFGWSIPARDPVALMDYLVWARDHRQEWLEKMESMDPASAVRSWRQAAEDFAGICREVCERRKA